MANIRDGAGRYNVSLKHLVVPEGKHSREEGAMAKGTQNKLKSAPAGQLRAII